MHAKIMPLTIPRFKLFGMDFAIDKKQHTLSSALERSLRKSVQ
jgi:hypothetical protein